MEYENTTDISCFNATKIVLEHNTASKATQAIGFGLIAFPLGFAGGVASGSMTNVLYKFGNKKMLIGKGAGNE
mgnify:CR=1 FL=1